MSRPLDLRYASEKLLVAVQALDNAEMREALGVAEVLSRVFVSDLTRISDATPPPKLRQAWARVFNFGRLMPFPPGDGSRAPVDTVIKNLSDAQLDRLERAIRALYRAVDELMCAYCGNPATTRDHVPAQALFRSPLPSNLITVPSCQPCNGLPSADEEYFGTIMVCAEAADSEEAAAVLADRIDWRGSEREGRLLARIMAATNVTVRDTPTGPVVEGDPIIRLEDEPIRRVLQKITRGLYWHELHQRVPDDMEVHGELILEAALSHPGAQVLLAHSASKVRGERAFEYRFAQASDNHNAAAFLMLFHNALFALGVVRRPGPLRKTKAARAGRPIR